MDRSSQRELPFAEAECSRADRSNLLGLAMLKIGVDAAEARLLDWIFAVTDGGIRGELKKNYDELSSRPRGMCCSRNKARAAVERLEHRGVIDVHRNRYRSGGQDANAYRINWEGVRAVIGLGPGATTEHPGATTEHPPAATRQGDAATGHPLIGITAFLKPSWPAGRHEASLEEAGGAAPDALNTESQAAWTSEERQAVVAALRSAGYDGTIASRLARESEIELKLSAADVLAICDEFSHPTNRTRFTRAGAIGYRIRNGTWPVDGVVPLHVARGHEARVEAKRTVRESETELYRIVSWCRRAKVPDDEIRQRLRTQIPVEICEAAGW